MKAIVYLNKNKVSFDGSVFDWDKNTLGDIFLSIRTDKKINEVRIVLGSDVSYIVGFKVDDIEKAKREEIFKISRGYFPFEVTNECFDWKIITLGEADLWAQVVAIDPSLLFVVSEAIKKSGLKVEWIIPIGVVIGTVSAGREAPVILKWKGKEDLSVLAQKGLVDLVTENDNNQISNFARNKWHLEVDPEEIILSESNFDFEDVVMSGKNRGNDADVLGINLLKNNSKLIDEALVPVIDEIVGSGESIVEKIVGVESKKQAVRPIFIIMLILVIVFLGGVLYWRSKGGNDITPVKPVLNNDSLSPSVINVDQVATQESVIDYSIYKVEVQNGSGVAGEAGRLKEKLLSVGFVIVDTTNALSPEEQTLISYKAALPAEVLAKAMENLAEYQIGNVLYLSDSTPYDLRIVIGSRVK